MSNEPSNDYLDLTDLAPDREQVLLVKGGPLRDLLGWGEIGMEDRAKIMKCFERIHKVTQKKRPTKNDQKKLEGDERTIVRIVVPTATPGELKKLNTDQLDAFSTRFLIAFDTMISQMAKAIGSEAVTELIQGRKTSAS